MKFNLHIKNTFWVYCVTFAILPITYLIRILYERNLSLADFGIYYGLFGFFAFFGFLRDWGLRDASIYYSNQALVQKDYAKVKTIFFFNQCSQLFFSLIIALLLYWKQEWIFATFYPNELVNPEAHIKTLFNLFLVQWVIITIWQTNQAFLSIFQNQRANSIFTFFQFSTIVIFALCMFGSMNNFEVPVFALLTASSVIALGSSIYISYRYYDIIWKPSLFLNRDFFKKIFAYASALVVAGLSNTIFVSTDTVIVQYFSGAENVAFYVTAVSSAGLLLLFLSPLIEILNPLAAKLWHANKKQSLGNLISFIMNHFLIPTLPLALVFLVFAQNFIASIYSKVEMLQATLPLQILCIGIITKGLNNLLAAVISSIGRPKELSKITLTVGLFNLVGNLILIQYYGIIGVVITTAVSYLITLVLYLKVLRADLPLSFDAVNTFKIIMASVGFFIIAFALKEPLYTTYSSMAIVNFLLNGGLVFFLSGTVYIVLLFVLRILDRAKIQYFRELVFSRFEEEI